MERAAALMERHDYVRYSEQVVRNYVNPNLGSTPVYDVEREMVYFKLASQYLWQWQSNGTGAERARVYARKLGELPNLHSMSKFLIARVQELDGGSYNRHYVNVPNGAGMWFFSVGAAANFPNEISFGDFKDEYARIRNEKMGGALGKGTQAGCIAMLLCLGALNSDDSLVVADLKSKVFLWVSDKQGNPVQIGASSWVQ